MNLERRLARLEVRRSNAERQGDAEPFMANLAKIEANLRVGSHLTHLPSASHVENFGRA